MVVESLDSKSSRWFNTRVFIASHFIGEPSESGTVLIALISLALEGVYERVCSGILRSSRLSVLLSSAVAWAQLSTAQLSGRVADESGAVLPGVTVTVVQTDTGQTRTATTDASGTYVLPNLPTGPYRLEASLQGFRTYVQTGIVLQVAATPAINVVLGIGSLEETVSVEAAAPLVDVQSAGISDVIDNERILELPLQGRQVTDLIVLAGAAVQTGVVGSRNFPGGVTISVAGGLPIGVGYVLDGATHNSPQSNVNLPMPFPDALQEFRVATSGLSAQNGMHASASVNAVTKSGTNAVPRQRVRVSPPPRAQRNEPICPRRPRRETQGRRPVAQSVRWDGGRSDCARPALLLRRLSGHRRSASGPPTRLLSCRRRRCSPAISRRSPHPRARAADRSILAAASSTTASIPRSSALPQ